MCVSRQVCVCVCAFGMHKTSFSNVIKADVCYNKFSKRGNFNFSADVVCFAKFFFPPVMLDGSLRFSFSLSPCSSQGHAYDNGISLFICLRTTHSLYRTEIEYLNHFVDKKQINFFFFIIVLEMLNFLNSSQHMQTQLVRENLCEIDFDV